jgi:hypothetical protein
MNMQLMRWDQQYLGLQLMNDGKRRIKLKSLIPCPDCRRILAFLGASVALLLSQSVRI